MLNDPNELRSFERIAHPVCRLTKAALQTITHNTNTTLLFDTERQDPFNMHSTSTNTGRITPNVPGFYLIGGAIRMAANTSGIRILAVYLNGVTPIAEHRVNAPTAGFTGATINTIYKAAPGDYFTLAVYQNTGGNLDVTKVSNTSPEFWAYHLVQ